MIGRPRAIGNTRYAVLQQEDLLLIYQSGYDWLEDKRLSKFPADALVYATWEQVQQVVIARFHEQKLYWSVMLDELTPVYGVAVDKQTLLTALKTSLTTGADACFTRETGCAARKWGNWE